ncbi:MAG: 4Fe-4S cluster-binding domain-containing protein, partial [Actinomycetota bacterium]|nr:4Fe-4S cluster-binding domain-containing protein [Actinomycetota bacterium]
MASAVDEAGKSPALEIAAVLPASQVNGPGSRAVIWLQGCDLRCAGCCNPDFLEIRPARTVRVEVVLEWLLGLEGVEGVTLSGGEPTLQ